jgi:hypothetical protein
MPSTVLAFGSLRLAGGRPWTVLGVAANSFNAVQTSFSSLISALKEVHDARIGQPCSLLGGGVRIRCCLTADCQKTHT